jgi:NDP-sugar pyrophosphorylase family protein
VISVKIDGCFLLCAGFGTRLRPLTNFKPKPLIPLLGSPILSQDLQRLSAIGLDSFFINTHHLAQEIEAYVSEQRHVSKEAIELKHEDKILGTGGGVANFSELIADEGLYLIKAADIYIPNLGRHVLHALHVLHESESEILLILAEKHLDGTTKVYYDANDQVQQFGGESNDAYSTFVGVHLIKGKWIKLMSNQHELSIIDHYLGLMGQGVSINCLRLNELWYDIGSPKTFFNANLELLEKLDSDANFQKSWSIDNPELEFISSEDQRKGLRGPCVIPKSMRSTMPATEIGPKVVCSNIIPNPAIQAIENSVLFDCDLNMYDQVIRHQIAAYSIKIDVQ